MKTAIALWTYAWSSPEVLPVLESVGASGVDAVSVHPDQLLAMDDGLRAEFVAAVAGQGLGVTVHGHCNTTRADVDRVVGWIGDRLVNYTMDRCLVPSPTGKDNHLGRMAPALRDLRDATAGTAVRYGFEDFPLDCRICGDARVALGELLECDRYGILVDVGHQHIWRSAQPDGERPTVADCFADLPVPLVEVHLHDNDGRRDQHAPLGHGSLDAAAVLAVLRARDEDFVLTCEYAPGLCQERKDEVLAAACADAPTWR
jgi:sugar phosphate isomerase/epimerase